MLQARYQPLDLPKVVFFGRDFPASRVLMANRFGALSASIWCVAERARIIGRRQDGDKARTTLIVSPGYDRAIRYRSQLRSGVDGRYLWKYLLDHKTGLFEHVIGAVGDGPEHEFVHAGRPERIQQAEDLIRSADGQVAVG